MIHKTQSRFSEINNLHFKIQDCKKFSRTKLGRTKHTRNVCIWYMKRSYGSQKSPIYISEFKIAKKFSRTKLSQTKHTRNVRIWYIKRNHGSQKSPIYISKFKIAKNFQEQSWAKSDTQETFVYDTWNAIAALRNYYTAWTLSISGKSSRISVKLTKQFTYFK